MVTLTLKPASERSFGEKLERGRKQSAAYTRIGWEGLPGMIGDMPGMVSGAAGWLADKIPGVSDENVAEGKQAIESTLRTTGKAVTGGYAADVILKALQMAGIISPETAQAIMAETEPPTSADIHRLTSAVLPESVNQYTEPLQDPNRWEQGVGTAAVMMPNLVGGPGAGAKQALTRFGTRVAAPAAVDVGMGEVTDRLVKAGKISPKDAAAIRVASQVVTSTPTSMMEKGLGARAAGNMADVTPQALREVEAALIADGMTPDAARAQIAAWGGGRGEGGQAMLVDVGEHGNIEQLGVKSGVTPGPGGAELKRKLKQRSQFAGERIRGEQSAIVGPPVNRDVELERFKKRSQTVGGQYDLAKDRQVRPSATQSIADQLDSELAVARGGLRGPLEEVRKSLDLPAAPGNLDPSAEGLHQMRQAIDQQISGADPGTPLFNRLTHYRKLVDAELKDIAPRMKQLDRRYAGIKGEKEAYLAGEQGPKKTVEGAPGVVASDAEFKATWDKLPPREKTAMQRGTARWLDQQTGMTPRERVKLTAAIEGDWNEGKLRTQFGDEKIDSLMAMIKREDVFQDRYTKIVHGSKTASAVDQNMPSSAGESALTTLAATASPTSAAKAFGVTTAKNWVGKVLSKSNADQRIKNDIGKLLASDRPEDVFRAMEQLKQVDKSAVMPRAMITALYARMAETGHR